MRVERPAGDVDLLALGDGVGLEERVHVLPAVEVADAADLGIHDHVGGVAGAVAEDEALNVSGADLAAVVNDVACRVDHNLGGVEAVEVDLRVAKRDENGVVLRGGADAVHLRGVGGKTVLPVLLQQWQAFLVVDAPHPIRIAGNP